MCKELFVYFKPISRFSKKTAVIIKRSDVNIILTWKSEKMIELTIAMPVLNKQLTTKVSNDFSNLLR